MNDNEWKKIKRREREKENLEATPECLILSIALAMLLRAVSAPMEISVPGKLFAIVEGMHNTGMSTIGWLIIIINDE